LHGCMTTTSTGTRRWLDYCLCPMRYLALFFEALEDAGSLPDLDEVAVGVADVATDLRSPVDRRG
jgi:hypothetical protein